MAENGAETKSETKRSILRDLTDQISDQVDLAALELGYETQEAGKRFLAAGIILVLTLTGFIVLQVAIVGGLMRAGLRLEVAALLSSLVYFALAAGVYWVLGRRDKRAGAPFAGTQKEIHETLKWIQKIFS
jgi:uncharacterized membrane protein YqjE